MRFENVYFPYGAYWCTPFCKWQGSFAGLPPIPFAAEVARRALAERELEPQRLRAPPLGSPVPSPSSFSGAPWLAALIGAERLSGPTISQACATSARLLAGAPPRIENPRAAGGNAPGDAAR